MGFSARSRLRRISRVSVKGPRLGNYHSLCRNLGCLSPVCHLRRNAHSRKLGSLEISQTAFEVAATLIHVKPESSSDGLYDGRRLSVTPVRNAIPLRRQPASPQPKPIRRPRKWTSAPTFPNLHRQILTLGRFPPCPLEDRDHSFL
jgi:hypothetical protein